MIRGHVPPPPIPPACKLGLLTPAQKSLVTMLANGLSPKEVGATMGVPMNTVRWWVREVYRVLGIDRAVVLTRWAVSAGLVPAVPRQP